MRSYFDAFTNPVNAETLQAPHTHKLINMPQNDPLVDLSLLADSKPLRRN